MNTSPKTKSNPRTFKSVVQGLALMAVVGSTHAQQAASSGSLTNTVQQPLTASQAQSETINAAGNIGVGPLIGEPMGVGVKAWLSETTAIDGGAGWSFADPDGFQLHGDFLFHKFDLFHIESGELPLYFGVGGRVKFVEHGDNRAGIRGPVGVSYLLPNSRLEFFAEVAPVLDLAPFTRLEWNGGIGVRFYFR